MTNPRRRLVTGAIVVVLAGMSSGLAPLRPLAYAAPAEDAPPADAPPDSAAAVPDTLLVPPTFEPTAPSSRPFLVPFPGARRGDLVSISMIDAFLLPPEGPSVVYDRVDLRLAGPFEWWELLDDAPGAFIAPPGYPGVVSAMSFRHEGPDGTRYTYDGRALDTGVAPVENPNTITKSSLAGVSVMSVSASHLYGPGAAGGAVGFVPVVQAPDRPFTEVTNYSGIFGQAGGSITSGQRIDRLGIFVDYGGAKARSWSLFDGHRAERYQGHLDWIGRDTRILFGARRRDERIHGFEVFRKRGDDGHEETLAIERRLGARWAASIRGIRQVYALRGDGIDGYTKRRFWRWGGDALVRYRAPETEVGLLVGASRDRHWRRDLETTVDDRRETTGHALVRLRRRIGRITLDASARGDRIETHENVVAAGATLSYAPGPGTRAWAHGARTVYRPAYFHRINDFYTQTFQGLDLPRGQAPPLPTGMSAAIGLQHRSGAFRLDAGVSADDGERVVAAMPSPLDGGLTVSEPDTLVVVDLSRVAAWGRLSVDVGLGALGRLELGGSGVWSGGDDVSGLQFEPGAHAKTHARLREDLFGGHLRLEGELELTIWDEIRTPLGRIDPDRDLTARITARVADIVLFYRSENILRESVATSAYEPELGFAPLTGQNILFGLSWILLD